MAQTTLTAVVPKRTSFEGGIKAKIADLIADLNTMFTEMYADREVVSVSVPLHATKTVYNLFVARKSYTVESIDYVPDIAQGGALTATVVKATGTATPASGTTPMHTANAIDLNATAFTTQPITLTATTANLGLVAGERIGLVLSGAMTVGSGLVTIKLKRA